MSGSVTPNLAQDIIDWVRDFLDPVIDLLGDPAARRALLEDLGLDPDAGATPQLDPAVRERVTGYLATVDPDYEAFRAAAADITQVLDALRGVIETAGAGGQAVADEIIHDLLTLSAGSFVRYRWRRLYWLARFLGLVEEKFTTEVSGSLEPIGGGIGSIAGSVGHTLSDGFSNLRVELLRPDRLLGALVGELGELMAFVLRASETEADAAAFGQTRLAPLGLWLGRSHDRVLYGWEPAPGAATPVADAIADRTLSLQLVGSGTSPEGTQARAEITVSAVAVPAVHRGPGLLLSLAGDAHLEASLDTVRYDLDERLGRLRGELAAGDLNRDEYERLRRAISGDWVFSVDIGSANGVDLYLPLPIPPLSNLEGVRLGGASEMHLQAGLARRGEAPGAPYLLGSAGATRLELGELSLRAWLDAADQGDHVELDLGLEALADRGALVVAAGAGDGFVRRILRDGELRLDLALGLGWSRQRGFYLSGGTGLTVTIPINRHLPGLDVDYLLIGVAPAPEGEPAGVSVSVGGGLRVRIGTSFTAAVDRLGFRMLFREAPDGRGDLGPWDVEFGYQPPAGVGLALDTDVAAGGGYLFFEPERDRYFGGLVLEVCSLTVSAVGLLSTRLPDGRRGYSLLISLYVEGFKPLPIGMNFTLDGVGGLIGIHRSVEVGVLRAGLKNQTLDQVLFPSDPLSRLPQLVTTLERVFPVTAERHCAGPTFLITWGKPTQVTIELAVLLEVPAPKRLLVLAQVRARVPSEDAPVVELNLDALGVVDFAAGTLSLDASLYKSRIVQTSLSGDGALRLRWKEEPGFLYCVGGFNPRFNPPQALELPKLKRITADFTRRENPRLRLEYYQAISSNSYQLGARADFYVAVSELSLSAFAGFDVLIRLRPFGFAADLSGAAAVKWGSHNLFGVALEASLVGPAPLTVSGRLTVKLWFFSKSFGFDKTLIDDRAPPPLPAVDPLPDLLLALGDPRSWSAELPGGGTGLVALRGIRGGPDRVVAHPLGRLTVLQGTVPLNLDIDRYGGAPALTRRFTIGRVILGEDADPPVEIVQDWFAPGQFLDLSDTERLSRPSFERMDAGLRIGADALAFAGSSAEDADLLATVPIDYETKLVDRDGAEVETTASHVADAEELAAATAFGAVARRGVDHTGRARYRGPRRGVRLQDPGYRAVDARDLSPARVSVSGFSAARQHAATKPGLQVVGGHELAQAVA